MFGFPVLCKEKKEEKEKSSQTGIRWGREEALGEISRPIHWDLCIKKEEQSRRKKKGEESEWKRSEKESAGDGFKLLVSQADKGSSCRLAVICIAHNIPFIHNISSPYFASSASLVKQLPVWCTFSLPIMQLPAILYISFSFLLAVSGWRKKINYISVTHAPFFHTHPPPLLL